MNILRVGKLSLVVLSLFILTNAKAQKAPVAPTTPAPAADGPALVWKKQIARIIDMGPNSDANTQNISDVSSENTLIDMFVNLIRGNKVLAYTASDKLFTVKLTIAELNKILAGKKDTVLLTDPVTNKTSTKITQHELVLDSVHKFKILEEWSCYPATGKTEIQIIGLAPLMNVYNDDGSTRGTTPMFWMRFNDISAILARYQQYHPNNTLAGHIWDDYFTNSLKAK